MLHPLSVNVQCSIAVLFIFIVMSFGTTLFFPYRLDRADMGPRYRCVASNNNITVPKETSITIDIMCKFGGFACSSWRIRPRIWRIYRAEFSLIRRIHLCILRSILKLQMDPKLVHFSSSFAFDPVNQLVDIS